MLNTDMIVEYFHANSLVVKDVVNNDSNPNEKSTMVVPTWVGEGIANIVVIHDGEKAEVVLIKPDGVRILDSVDNYNSIVANVKSLLPVRPKLPKGPMA